MIRILELGEKSKNITEAIFGDGDIMMTRLQYESGMFSLVLNEAPPHPIGETTNEYVGKTTDDLPGEVRICLSFKNPQSLNALIHSLVELQKDVFDGKLNTLK